MTDAWDGRPQNPERDGWHWLGDDRPPQPVLWLAEFAAWADGTMHSAQSVPTETFTWINDGAHDMHLHAVVRMPRQ